MTAPKRAVERRGGRAYQVLIGDKLVDAPGASGLSKLLASDGLINWKMYRAVDAVIEKGLDRNAAIRSAHDPSEATVRGNDIHDLIEKWDKGEPIPPTVYSRDLERWRSLCRDYEITVEHSELSVARVIDEVDELAVAGTLDSVAVSPKLAELLKTRRSRFVCDVKTGKSVLPDHAIQLAALANCDGILEASGRISPSEPLNYEWGLVAHLPEVGEPSIVPIRLEPAWRLAQDLVGIWKYRNTVEKTLLADPLHLSIKQELEELTRFCRKLQDAAPATLKALIDAWPVKGKRLTVPDGWTSEDVSQVWAAIEKIDGTLIEKFVDRFGLAKAAK